MSPETKDVEIARLGAGGDGVAVLDHGPHYIPYALPGERWRMEGENFHRLTASPARSTPICRHFGQCGGCTSQHMSLELADTWKRDIIAEAFRHRAVAAEIMPVRRVAPGSRRRASLGVKRQPGRVVIGYREEGRHRLVDLEECPVLDPMIVAALEPLRRMAALSLPEDHGGRLRVTRLDDGLDVAFEDGHRHLSPETRGRLAALAHDAHLVRLTVAGELIATQVPSPGITIAGVTVRIPQTSFLQAVPEAEALLIGLVGSAIPRKARRVADLFCGIGTFTFSLARRVSVVAIDGDRQAIEALQQAARHAAGLKPVEARVRDLIREPMSARELGEFDALVFDPPRAGASDQAARIAKSKVPVAVAVSCNPATLARDAKILIDGGMRMGPITPVDQFLFSPHVEVVTVFER